MKAVRQKQRFMVNKSEVQQLLFKTSPKLHEIRSTRENSFVPHSTYQNHKNLCGVLKVYESAWVELKRISNPKNHWY